jgi:hypothetical protein
MALDNLVSIEFTQAEIDDIMAHLLGISDIIHGKVVNLTPDQRTQYGRLGDGTENFVVKTQGYAAQKPEIIPFFVDRDELKKDVKARDAITPMLKQSKIIFEALDDTHKLLGWDIYNNIIAIYRNTKMLSRQNVPGINVIYEDLKKQFPHQHKPPTPTP